MFTSVTEIQKRKTRGAGIIHGFAAGFCLIFAAIYTLNGYGRSSAFMSLCFVPCAVSCILFFILGHTSGWKVATTLTRYLWHCGSSTITVAMALTGVFNIAGVTVNWHMPLFWLCGGLLLAASIVSAVVNGLRRD